VEGDLKPMKLKMMRLAGTRVPVEEAFWVLLRADFVAPREVCGRRFRPKNLATSKDFGRTYMWVIQYCHYGRVL